MKQIDCRSSSLFSSLNKGYLKPSKREREKEREREREREKERETLEIKNSFLETATQAGPQMND